MRTYLISNRWLIVVFVAVALGLRQQSANAQTPQEVTIPCPPTAIPTPTGGVLTAVGNANNQEFEIVPATPEVSITNQQWSFVDPSGTEHTVPNTALDTSWGSFTLFDGNNTLGWQSPLNPGNYTVKVKAKRTCLGGEGGGGPGDDGSFEVDFGATVYGLQIFRDGTNITDPPATDQSVQVGTIVNLSATVVPSSLTLSNIQWTLPGWNSLLSVSTVVHDWTHSDGYIDGAYSAKDENSLLWPIESSQLTSANLSYAWIDGSIGEKVSLSATVTTSGGVSVNANPVTAMFDITRPSYGIQITEAGHTNFFVNKSDLSAELASGLPDFPNYRGVTITMEGVPVTDYSNCDFWQLVNAENTSILTTDGWIIYSPTSGLDTSDPYGKLYASATVDTPSQPVTATDTQLFLGESFTDFLMYKPPGAEHVQSIWVPMSCVSWSWAGIAQMQGMNWSRDTDLVSKVSPAKATGTSTETYPAWFTNCGAGTFVPE